MYLYIYIVFITEEFFKVAIESWPECSCYLYTYIPICKCMCVFIYIYIYIYIKYICMSIVYIHNMHIYTYI